MARTEILVQTSQAESAIAKLNQSFTGLSQRLDQMLSQTQAMSAKLNAAMGGVSLDKELNRQLDSAAAGLRKFSQQVDQFGNEISSKLRGKMQAAFGEGMFKGGTNINTVFGSQSVAVVRELTSGDAQTRKFMESQLQLAQQVGKVDVAFVEQQQLLAKTVVAYQQGILSAQEFKESLIQISLAQKTLDLSGISQAGQSALTGIAGTKPGMHGWKPGGIQMGGGGNYADTQLSLTGLSDAASQMMMQQAGVPPLMAQIAAGMSSADAATQKLARSELQLRTASGELSAQQNATIKQLAALSTSAQMGMTPLAGLSTKMAEAHGITTKFQLSLMELSKAAQIGYGPLSGVASRITAFGILAESTGFQVAALAVGVIGLMYAFDKIVGVASEAQAEILTLQGVLKATGDSTGLTLKEINSYAEQMARTTMATESDARKAAGVLAAFPNIQGENFKRALMVAQNLAALGFGGLVEETHLVARALEDPNTNLQALTRSLGKVPAEVRMVADALIEMGQRSMATGLLLTFMENRLGNAAESQASGLSGALHKFWTALHQTNEKLGESSGALQAGASFWSFLADKINAAADAMTRVNQQSSTEVAGAGLANWLKARLGPLLVSPLHLPPEGPEWGAPLSAPSTYKAAPTKPAFNAADVATGLVANIAEFGEYNKLVKTFNDLSIAGGHSTEILAELQKQLLTGTEGIKDLDGGLSTATFAQLAFNKANLDTHEKIVALEDSVMKYRTAIQKLGDTQADLVAKAGMTAKLLSLPFDQRAKAIEDMRIREAQFQAGLRPSLYGTFPLSGEAAAEKQRKMGIVTAGTMGVISNEDLARQRESQAAFGAQVGMINLQRQAIGGITPELARQTAETQKQLEFGKDIIHTLTTEEQIQIRQAGTLAVMTLTTERLKSIYNTLRDRTDEMQKIELQRHGINSMSVKDMDIALAKMQEEQRIAKELPGIDAQYRDSLIKTAETIAGETYELNRQKEAVSTVTNLMTSSFDKVGGAITEAFTQGNGAAVDFRGVMQGINSEIIQLIVKLGVINPLINSLFPSANLQTLSGVASALANPQVQATTANTTAVGVATGGMATLTASIEALTAVLQTQGMTGAQAANALPPLTSGQVQQGTGYGWTPNAGAPTGAATGTATGPGSMFSNAWEMIKNSTKSLFDMIGSLFKSGMSGLGDMLSSAWQAISGMFQQGGSLQGVGSMASSALAWLMSAQGNVFGGGHIYPFAQGASFALGRPSDLVFNPTLFQFGAGQIGMMGEAGPEAIMPLTRGRSGELGVKAHGYGDSGGGSPVNIQIVNNNGSDVSVKRVGTRGWQVMIEAAVGDSIDRGGIVGQKIEKNYGVSRAGVPR